MNTKFTSLALSAVLFAGIAAIAQPTPVGDSLNINDVSALMYADGVAFWNQNTNLPSYRVPKTGKACTIYAAGLWVGGLDAGGKLHLAASTYKQNGTDVWPGPKMDSLNYSGHQDTLWNKIWKVNKSTIDSFRQGKCVGIPASIKNWPGDGNVALGQMAHLAPYVDSNHNGYYDPSGGDYPLIRGDQAMYMIYNDDRGTKHKESNAPKMGIEVHLMAYQFNMPADTAVSQTTFLHYDIYNLSTSTYDSVYLGYWCDMDIGNGGNDYIGCDSANNYWYTYNGTNTDPDGTGGFAGEIGYHNYPPAEAVAYLCDTMTHFQYYNNDFSTMGNPTSDTMYYDYLKSIWGDKSHVKYGGNGFHTSSNNASYMFSGNPVTLTGWTEAGAGNPAGDRRGLSSMGPLTFVPGKSLTMDIALVFGQTSIANSALASVTTLAANITDVRNFYSLQSYGCNKTLLGLNEPVAEQNAIAKLYPNPFNTGATLSVNRELENGELMIYDMFGREVYSVKDIHTQNISINRNQLANGMYFYVLMNNGARLTDGKFIIN